MTEQALKELTANADRMVWHSSPIELRVATQDLTDDGKPKTLWRMPLTGEIVEPGTKGAYEWRRWWAVINTENRDTQGGIVERNASIAGFLAWMAAGGGNVRFMHYLDPVGRIFEGDYEIRQDGIYAGFSLPVTEKEAIQKIDTGLIRFVSIGFNPDWTSPEPVTWDPDGTTRWKAIIQVELSVVDFGSCPGTHIQEERTGKPESLKDRLIRHRDNLTDMIKSITSPGEAPDNHRSSQSKEENELDETKLKETLSGALKPITDRMDSLEQKVSAVQAQPPTTEPPTPPPTPPAAPAPTEQRAASPDSARMDQIEQKLDKVVGVLEKLGTGTAGTPSGQTVDQLVDQFAEQVNMAAAPSHNAPLSFIECADTGQPLTLERLRKDIVRG